MKEICCACGKKIRFSVLLGDTGERLTDGYVCYDCCKAAGYGKGFFSSMGLALTTKADFMNKYNSMVKAPIKEKSVDFSQMTEEQLEEEIKKYIVLESGLNLENGEICYFSTECCSVKYKNVVVGSSKTFTHVGDGRKGTYLGAGVSQKTNNRQTVSEQYPGNFYVTNKKIACNAIKLSFEIPLAKITAMTTYSDGVTIMSGGKSFNVTFSNVERFKNLLNLNNEIEKRKKENGSTVESPQSSISSTGNSASVVSELEIPKLIREYKTLLEEGIISEEEFQMKKAVLLAGDSSNAEQKIGS